MHRALTSVIRGLGSLPKSCLRPTRTGVRREVPIRHYQIVAGSMEPQAKEPEIVYRTITKDDQTKVTGFLGKEFFRKEAISKILGTISYAEFHTFMDAVFPHVFQDGVSVLAENKDTGEIFGTMLSFLETRSSPSLDTFTDGESESPKIQVILEILGKLTEGIDLFNKYNVDKSLHLFMASVKQGEGGHGLGKHLVTKSEDRGREQGAQIAFAEATSLRSRMMFEHMNYDVVKTLSYVIKFGEGSDGKDEDVFCSFCVKRLDDQ